MTLILLIAFLGLVTGSFILLDISPFEFAINLMKPFKDKQKTIKTKVLEVTKKKKPRGLKLLIQETKNTLEATNKRSL